CARTRGIQLQFFDYW
nr:immunoglobulin heavy chain junction region [Macaca mulatta]MOW75414.1 immunoglobulin heavy chain junction region [Macaca mulatta]MOW75500.1 immunoglobulin heavy chain junction region [Macaca mulatta]MOW75553.1 immunoglobulin heavy chain junction region [Macaca mulatta]MOW75618.1 immunoglobulin heavy chain junction region [Macaca mulatta]